MKIFLVVSTQPAWLSSGWGQSLVPPEHPRLLVSFLELQVGRLIQGPSDASFPEKLKAAGSLLAVATSTPDHRSLIGEGGP